MGAVTPDCLCPRCGMHLDRAASPTAPRVAPRRGDLSVCFYCASLLAFDVDMRLAAVSSAQFEQLRIEEPETAQIIERYQQSVHSRNMGRLHEIIGGDA